jgi:hypothetical protein
MVKVMPKPAKACNLIVLINNSKVAPSSVQQSVLVIRVEIRNVSLSVNSRSTLGRHVRRYMRYRTVQ